MSLIIEIREIRYIIKMVGVGPDGVLLSRIPKFDNSFVVPGSYQLLIDTINTVDRRFVSTVSIFNDCPDGRVYLAVDEQRHQENAQY